jgi:endonuclease/exonuclease/phosphatase family metal-dependent hydrolase
MGGLFALFGDFWGQGAQAEEPQAPNRPVRVMSWNIGYTWTNGVLDYPAVAKAIKASSPDVVGVQEILRGCGDRYGYDEAARRGRRLEADYKILPWTLDYQRGVQDLLVNVRGVPLRIYNTHLQNNPTSPQAKQDRTDQVRAILAYAGELEEPTVLTGDLNSNPDWSEIRPWFGVFGDSWVAGGDGGPGYTLEGRRIDYVLHSSDIGVRRTQVVPVVPSDHEQVVSDLLLPARQRGRH